jgi:hypothetical protein
MTTKKVTHTYTHEQLVLIAYRWVMRAGGAAVAFRELVTIAMETPDVLGIGGTVHSILIECKISRSDFLADRKKPWRANPSMGMGSHRIYCAPAGLLHLEELPDKWGLLSVESNGRCTLSYRPDPERPGAKFLCERFAQPRNERGEAAMMLSALRRLQGQGLMENVYRGSARAGASQPSS